MFAGTKLHKISEKTLKKANIRLSVHLMPFFNISQPIDYKPIAEKLQKVAKKSC